MKNVFPAVTVFTAHPGHGMERKGTASEENKEKGIFY